MAQIICIQGKGSPTKNPLNKPTRVKRESPPQQPGNRCEKDRQRRQMIKDRMNLMRFKLALLHEVHDSGDAGQSERTIGNQ